LRLAFPVQVEGQIHPNGVKMNPKNFPVSCANRGRRKSLVAAALAAARRSVLHRAGIHRSMVMDYVTPSDVPVMVRLEFKPANFVALSQAVRVIASEDCEVTNIKFIFD
jgi:hypothetical protein